MFQIAFKFYPFLWHSFLQPIPCRMRNLMKIWINTPPCTIRNKTPNGGHSFPVVSTVHSILPLSLTVVFALGHWIFIERTASEIAVRSFMRRYTRMKVTAHLPLLLSNHIPISSNAWCSMWSTRYPVLLIYCFHPQPFAPDHHHHIHPVHYIGVYSS